MARIQILELPEGARDERAPFILVVDQIDRERYCHDFNDGVSMWDGMAERLGARGVIAFEETIDIPANTVELPGTLLASGSREAVEETLERVRGEHHQHKADLSAALGLSKLHGWDDILNAATAIRRERDAFGDAIRGVAEIHRAIEDPHQFAGQQGLLICGACSVLDPDATTRLIPYPCGTTKALAPAEPGPPTKAPASPPHAR